MYVDLIQCDLLNLVIFVKIGIQSQGVCFLRRNCFALTWDICLYYAEMQLFQLFVSLVLRMPMEVRYSQFLLHNVVPTLMTLIILYHLSMSVISVILYHFTTNIIFFRNYKKKIISCTVIIVNRNTANVSFPQLIHFFRHSFTVHCCSQQNDQCV